MGRVSKRKSSLKQIITVNKRMRSSGVSKSEQEKQILSCAVLPDKRITLVQNFSKSEQPTSFCDSEIIFIEIGSLKNLFSSCCCSTCGSNSLNLSFSKRHGFANDLSLACNVCDTRNSFSTSTHTTNDKRSSFKINHRVVDAMTRIGKGYAAVETFSMAMNMHCINSKSFTEHLNELKHESSQTSKDLLDSVRRHVRDIYCELNSNRASSTPVELTVSYDGSWHTRGHASNFGVGCVIDVISGYVLDFEVLSKVCQHCRVAEKELGRSTPEFDVWFSGHSSDCQKNYSGSSCGMEVEIADLLWRRSESFGFRYTKMLGDGDSKTFNHLNDIKPYGPDIVLEKEECINHVSKRMGTALRNLVSSEKKRGVTLGGKKYGGLKDTTIKKITRYYQNAIKNNLGDIKSMKNAIYSILDHCRSTDNKPLHQKCPQGEMSWCFFNRAVANGENPGTHAKNLKTPLRDDVCAKVVPIFQRLACGKLLERCLLGRTQNSNESLHSRIWSRCPKVSNASKRRVEIAVEMAVMQFNLGKCRTVARDKMDQQTLKLASRRDKIKMRKSLSRSTMAYKRYRKSVTLARIRANGKEKNDSFYKAGAF